MQAPGTVLLIEPDDALRQRVHESLEVRGHTIIDAARGDAVHDMTIAMHPDLVLLDVDIPNVLPESVVNEIRADERTAEVPIILLGADHMLSVDMADAVDSLEKPLRTAALIARVEMGLELKRLRDEVRREHEEALLNPTDALTGLYSFRRLWDELAHFGAAAKRYEQSLSIVLFDMDRFDAINHLYGRDVGDHVLCDIAQRLASDVRTSDIVGRWRTDQFMAILPCTDARGASFFAERFRQTLAEFPCSLPDGGAITATASFGCAEGSDENMMVQVAESAVSAAKRRGRNSVVVGSHQST
jgi:diguanylate cyclase (GGDEF)-like protein